MSIEEGATQILNRLGLTISQARIYLTLLKLEKATAKTISKHSKVARQEVYRILVELEEKSLVERIIATPTEFKPVPLENGLPFLIEEKRKNMSEIQKEANKLLLSLRILVKPKETPREEKTEFILVPENKALLLRMKRALDAAQNSIDVIYPKEEFLQVLFNLSDKFQNALERGAKIRCLLNEPLDANSWPVTIQFIAENPLFEIRIMSECSEEKIWVYDKKEMLVSTCPQCGHAQAPFLWTNAAPCIKLAQNYFDISWKKAAKVKI